LPADPFSVSFFEKSLKKEEFHVRCFLLGHTPVFLSVSDASPRSYHCVPIALCGLSVSRPVLRYLQSLRFATDSVSRRSVRPDSQVRRYRSRFLIFAAFFYTQSSSFPLSDFFPPHATIPCFMSTFLQNAQRELPTPCADSIRGLSLTNFIGARLARSLHLVRLPLLFSELFNLASLSGNLPVSWRRFSRYLCI